MNETSKALRRLAGTNALGQIVSDVDPLWEFARAHCPKPWLDIGAGSDPLPGAEALDVHNGDAQTLTPGTADSLEAQIAQVWGMAFENETPPEGRYGLIWSSHCLEHLKDPTAALAAWWKALKPDGILWLLVPDFALYEHAIWPSVMNRDHQVFFSCHGDANHTEHYILDELWRTLPDAKLLRLQTVATGYDISRILDPVDQTHGEAEASCELVLRKLR